MSPEPRKRAAFESPARLARPLAVDPAMRRPITTVAGGVLVLLRVAAGVAWLVATTIDHEWLTDAVQAELQGTALTPADAVSLSIGILWGLIGAMLLVDLVLAVFILRGFNTPRVLVMVFSVFSVSSSFVAWWVQGQDIRISTTLLTISLDILILLALSSRSAAAYARRNERRT